MAQAVMSGSGLIPTRRPLSGETRAATAADPRPWLEMRPKDYIVQDDYPATEQAVRAIVQRLRDEGLRLRLLLDEVADFGPWASARLTPECYQVGYSWMVTEATEIIITLKDGRRYLCAGKYLWERGFI